MKKMQGIIEGEQKYIRAEVQFVPDTQALALHSEIPLVIRSLIIPQATSIRLCVSYGSENKGDTLFLPTVCPKKRLCCNQAVPTPPLVFCLIQLHLLKLNVFAAF